MKYQSVEHIMDLLDIDVFSVSEVGNLSDLLPVYEARMAQGLLTGFEPQSPLRTAPDAVLAEAKSVIAIAVPFGIKNGLTSGVPRGFITNMAWEFDYHETVRTRLEMVGEALLQYHPDAELFYAVDTGPVNDRMTAYGAGLGWRGRNQFLIDDQLGTGFYIGILITDFEIENSPKWRSEVVTKCGACRKCQIACPSGALGGDFDFDGQKCISALTQFKRDLSFNERYAIGRSLYGCDICQWVCPHNSQNLEVPSTLSRKTMNQIEPFELLGHSNKSFKRTFGKMGFAWRGLRVLKRNALIVIGNDRRREDYPRLLEIFEELPEDLQKYAVYAMMLVNMESALAYFRKLHLQASGSENAVKAEGLYAEAREVERWIYSRFRYEK